MNKLKGAGLIFKFSTSPFKIHSRNITTPALSSFRFIHSDEDYLQNSKIPTMHFQKSLPRLPIPKLEDTIQRYLASQKPLLLPEQYENTRKIAANFLNFEGRALQAELVALDKRNKHTSYIKGPWTDMYLKKRDSILNYNPFLLFADDPDATIDQLTRATKFIHAALRFKKSLDENKSEPDVYHMNPKKSDTDTFRLFASLVPQSLSCYVAYLYKAFPLDMSQYAHLFNSTRVPKPVKDELKVNKESRQIVVSRNGNFFVFDAIKEDGSLVSKDEIHANLSAIMQASNEQVSHPLSVLTTEDRDKWADARSHLISDPKNADMLDKIDSALFPIVLDDKECSEEKDAFSLFLHGDGYSRWFDKPFHLAVSSNAKVAINVEHAWVDGVAVACFIDKICGASAKDRFQPRGVFDGPLSIEKLDFNLDGTTKASIKKAHQNFNERKSKVDIDTSRLESFGKKFLKANNLSTDAIMQLAFQLAYYRQNGKHPATHESCSTAAFKHGRYETLRGCTSATVAVCEAFESSHLANVDEMVAMLQESSKCHSELAKKASMGQGFDRHLFALKCLAEKAGKSVEFFEDPAYKNINHHVISNSTVPSTYGQMGGFAPVVSDGFGIGYKVTDDWVGFYCTSYNPGSPNLFEFTSLIRQSLLDIKAVLEGKNFKLS